MNTVRVYNCAEKQKSGQKLLHASTPPPPPFPRMLLHTHEHTPQSHLCPSNTARHAHVSASSSRVLPHSLTVASPDPLTIVSSPSIPGSPEPRDPGHRTNRAPTVPLWPPSTASHVPFLGFQILERKQAVIGTACPTCASARNQAIFQVYRCPQYIFSASGASIHERGSVAEPKMQHHLDAVASRGFSFAGSSRRQSLLT